MAHHRDPEVAVMDRKNIRYGGGASRIEFCDLFINKRTLLHVKRYGGSSAMSHLFSQGVVSATLFLQDRDFRQKVQIEAGDGSSGRSAGGASEGGSLRGRLRDFEPISEGAGLAFFQQGEPPKYDEGTHGHGISRDADEDFG